jgi:hypothetical protein
MADDLIYDLNETKRISHKLASEDGTTTFSIASVNAYIYNLAGTAVVDGTAGGVAAGVDTAATEHEVYFPFSPSTEGDYSYRLKYVIGTQTLFERGFLTVFSAASKYLKYIRRIADLIAESEAGEAQKVLSTRQLRDAAIAAVHEYSRWNPRLVLKDAQALTASQWEYTLWSEWEKGFSQIRKFEYPIDATVQTRAYLEPASRYIAVDEDRLKFQFLSHVPSAGETYRAYITTRHTLADATDTAYTDAPQHFDAICRYGAGLACGTAERTMIRVSGQGASADVVSYRDKPQMWAWKPRPTWAM